MFFTLPKDVIFGSVLHPLVVPVGNFSHVWKSKTRKSIADSLFIKIVLLISLKRRQSIVNESEVQQTVVFWRNTTKTFTSSSVFGPSIPRRERASAHMHVRAHHAQLASNDPVLKFVRQENKTTKRKDLQSK
jgi:hypothetical protein